MNRSATCLTGAVTVVLSAYVPMACAVPGGDVAGHARTLLGAGIVTEVDYWATRAVEGRLCDGDRVAGLLLRAGRYLGAADDFPQALGVLERERIIWNDYWASNAVADGACRGEYVATVLRLLATRIEDRELAQRHAPPQGVIELPEPSAFALSVAATSRTVNPIIGTQTFSPAYQFTTKPRLLETAEVIRDMGATAIKFHLTARYAGPRGNVPVADPAISSLTQLARDEPTHRRVLDMPFAHVLLWAHCFGGDQLPSWKGGFSDVEKRAEYAEIRELTAHLLTAYRGTGKTFYLGHWEGDGWLRHSISPENDARVTPEAVKAFTEWLNVRQTAVDDAKREVVPDGVQVWHYTEVNHVWLAMKGRPALVNRVLPNTAVDLVSYSSYDTQRHPDRLKAALTYIEAQLAPKPGITGRRVFIGEYGFPAERHSSAEQDRLSRQLMVAAIEWGCPLVLYWELYNNEVMPDGRQRGFWMIDDRNVKQPVCRTHRRFYDATRAYTEAFRADHGRLPDDTRFRRWAVDWLRGEGG